MMPCRGQRYDVTVDGSGYAIAEEGDPLAAAVTPEDVRDTIRTRAHRRAFELASLKGWVRLRGALVDVAGTRILVVGPPGAEWKPLALRLLLDGAAVQGDDSVLLRAGSAVAVPRPFVLDGASVAMLPELAGVLAGLPRVGGVALLDPARDLGVPWRLRVGALDHVVVLDDGPGPVACLAAGPADVLADLTRSLVPVTETKPALLRALTTALAPARCHRMHVGDVGAMGRALVAATC